MLPFALLLTLFLPAISSAQGWYRVGTANHDIQIVDENTVVVVGYAGRIIRSNDDGVTWQQQRPHVGNDLNSVHFYDRQVGVVVGDTGIALRTENGGATWRRVKTGTRVTLRRLTTAGDTNLVAVGDSGTILRSTDRGQSWELVARLTEWNLRGVDMRDASVGVAVGDSGLVFRTTDGGGTWLRTDSLTSSRLHDVLYLTPDSVIAVGDRFQTLLSSDAGRTWTSVVDSLRGTARYYSLRRVTSIPGGDLLAVGEAYNAGNIWRSSDRGRSWVVSRTGTVETAQYPFLAMAFNDPNNGYVVGIPGTIYRTDDAGHSWQLRSKLPLMNEFRPILAIDTIKLLGTRRLVGSLRAPSNAVIGVAFREAGGGYWRSADTGVTWTHAPINDNEDFYDVHFFDSANGIAVTQFGWIFQTGNGGASWEYGFLPGSSGRVTGLEFRSREQGFAYGDGGVVNYKTGSDEFWHVGDLAKPGDEGFIDGVYVDGRTLLLVALTGGQGTPPTAGRVYISRDSGATWQISFQGQIINFIGVIDARRWLITRSTGGFLRTQDAGQTWNPIDIAGMGRVEGVRFFNASDGYAYGKSGIWRSSDGGQTWQQESLAGSGFADRFPEEFQEGAYIREITLMPNRRTLLASGHGVILRKDLSEPIPLPTASAPSINETASSLRLSVLPNPARDAAVLRITGVKSLSGTTLHIYDVRGQVVADVSRELRLGSDGSTIEIKLPVDLLRSGSYSVRGVVGGESVQGMFVVAK